MEFKNTDYNFSFYQNIYNTTPDNTIDVNQLIEVVKYGYLKNQVATLRSITDKKERNKLKCSTLPAVTLSGLFKERNNEGLVEHSGLLQIDIDDVVNYEKVFNQVIKDSYSYVAFRSPSGNGIKVIVKIKPYVDTHYEQFCAFKKYYSETYGIKIDDACKDISRLMLLSYDPHLFCNPFSELFTDLYVPEVIITKPKAPSNIKINSNNALATDNSHIVSFIKQIEQQSVDITGTYKDWFRIGYAFASEFGEDGREYFHRVSRFHSTYDYSETEAMYTNLMKNNNGSISIGTFVYYAKENGIDLVNNNTVDKQQSKPSLVPDSELEIVLKAKRIELSRVNGVPPYVIFNNQSIEDILLKRPTTEVDLSNIYGFGEKNAKSLAADLLPILKAKDLSAFRKSGKQFYKLPEIKVSDKDKLEALKKWRLKESNREGVMTFKILSNRVLNDIVDLKPETIEELSEISGIPTLKAKTYGPAILKFLSAKL